MTRIMKPRTVGALKDNIWRKIRSVPIVSNGSRQQQPSGRVTLNRRNAADRLLVLDQIQPGTAYF